MNILFQTIGWVGVVLVVYAYYLISSNRVEGDSRYYQGLNIAGSLLLILSFAFQEAWQGVAINAVWVIIGLLALRR